MMTQQTNRFTYMVFMMGFVVWVLGGGLGYSQTPEGDNADPPPAIQEEPGTSENQGKVLERGIMRRDRPGLPGFLTPKSTAPSPPAPKVLTPSGAGLSPSGTLSINAPTPSLTAVVNAIQLKHKGLTTLISLPPNLPVTQSVEISIGYFSPAGSYAPGTQRITQAYVQKTGNHFLNHDPEGDGKPRQMRVDITLRELQPGGQSFAVIRPSNLDPLYDITVSPLRFTLYNNCDRIGKSEIILRWRSPDSRNHSIPKFSVNAGMTKRIAEFAWSVREVSTKGIFFEPAIIFNEDDLGVEYIANLTNGEPMLVSGKGQHFDLLLNEGSAKPTTYITPKKCQAKVTYNISRRLLKFPDLK